MIKALIFDFYGVLISDDLWDFTGVSNTDKTEINLLSDKVNIGEIGWDEFCEGIADVSGKSIDEVKQLYESTSINRPLIHMIGTLSHSYQIGLLTNANRAHISRFLDDMGIGELFDSIVVSADVGVIKPSPEIYEMSLKDLGSKPEESIMIDDNLMNCEGAERVGMDYIHFQHFPKFVKDLEAKLK